MIKQKQSRQNFTLIELLVVIAIIAILASMLLPALNNAREVAKKISCVNNMKNVGTLLYMYCDNNKGFLPFKSIADRDFAPMLAGKTPSWSYMEGFDRKSPGGPFICPASKPIPGVQYYRCSYMINKGIRDSKGKKGGCWYYSGSNIIMRNFAQIPNNSVMVVETEMCTTRLGTGGLANMQCNAWEVNNYLSRDVATRALQGPGFANHRMTANFLFKDGHVSNLRAGVKFTYNGSTLDSWDLISE